MSISIAGINIPNAILNLEFEVARTQLILEWIIKNNPNVRGPTQDAMALITKDSVEMLKQKYPEAGIEQTVP